MFFVAYSVYLKLQYVSYGRGLADFGTNGRQKNYALVMKISKRGQQRGLVISIEGLEAEGA